jgi:hypothetical protein
MPGDMRCVSIFVQDYPQQFTDIYRRLFSLAIGTTFEPSVGSQ